MDDFKDIRALRKYRPDIHVADPHDLDRAKRWGTLIHAENGLAFYHYKDVTYVAPIAHPPLLQYIKGGRD